MIKHYIKAKYEVKLSASGDCVLFQREDDRFMFLSSTSSSVRRDHFIKRFTKSTRWDGQTVYSSYWTLDAKGFIQLALSGDLKPFWTCENETENKVAEENKCTCPYENFTWASGPIGCQCGKS